MRTWSCACPPAAHPPRTPALTRLSPETKGKSLEEIEATVAGDTRKLIAWVLFGVRPETNQPTRSIAAMPQFAWLNDEDVAAVLTHVRSSFGNSQPAVTAAEVAEVRAAGRPQ